MGGVRHTKLLEDELRRGHSTALTSLSLRWQPQKSCCSGFGHRSDDLHATCRCWMQSCSTIESRSALHTRSGQCTQPSTGAYALPPVRSPTNASLSSSLHCKVRLSTVAEVTLHICYVHLNTCLFQAFSF